MRGWLCALTILLIPVLLTACGGQNGAKSDEADAVRARFTEKTACSMQAEVTADYGDKVYEYTLKYSRAEDGTGTIEVLAPSEVAGIKATVREESLALEYDGASLETGKLSGDGLTPMDALPSMLRSWREAAVSQTGQETLDGKKTLRIAYRISGANEGTETVEQVAWFDPDTCAPVQAETLVDGAAVIRCTFTEFKFE